jgi:hypothetical protein
MRALSDETVKGGYALTFNADQTPTLIDGALWLDFYGEPIGPYTTKAEVREAAAGLARYDKWGHLARYVVPSRDKTTTTKRRRVKRKTKPS